MLDSIYHMTSKLLENRIFGVKMSKFSHLLRNVIMDVKSYVFRKSISMHVHVVHCEIFDVKHLNITQRCNNVSYLEII